MRPEAGKVSIKEQNGSGSVPDLQGWLRPTRTPWAAQDSCHIFSRAVATCFAQCKAKSHRDCPEPPLMSLLCSLSGSLGIGFLSWVWAASPIQWELGRGENGFLKRLQHVPGVSSSPSQDVFCCCTKNASVSTCLLAVWHEPKPKKKKQPSKQCEVQKERAALWVWTARK